MEREAKDAAKSSKLAANRYLVPKFWEPKAGSLNASALIRSRGLKRSAKESLRFLFMTFVKIDKTQCLAPFP